jgi:aryl-alcohol dehydrogenase-like predicted oxidoreductase
MSDQRKTPAEIGPATARGEGASLAAACARAIERRRLLLALVAMTGSVVVGGCRRTSAEGVRKVTAEAPPETGDGLPGSKGETLTVAQRPADDKLGPRLPLRRLGSTGVEVTLLGAGGVHIGDAKEEDAQEVIETAIAEGVRFFDTANMYSEGRSEQRLGRYLVPKYRDHVFLMSKSLATNGKDAIEDLETSLRRCGCDYFDLWQIHALRDPTDADNRVAAGILDACERAVKEGKVKHVGFTGHANFRGHLRMLEHVKKRGLPVATAQMPINLVDPHYASFTTHVVKPCLDHGMGILAMKTLAFGRLLGKNLGWQRQDVKLTPIVPELVSLEQALNYVWSLPVSVLISGMENAKQVKQNAAIARNAGTLDDGTRLKLVAAVEGFSGRDVEFYKD